MRYHFLGGASEVGASCIVVEAGGRRVLVDAGIRMGAEDPRPDLGRLQDIGGIDAVVVTHAHADHIGALPLVAGAFSSVPVVATPATAALMAIMLEDAVRIGAARPPPRHLRWKGGAGVRPSPGASVILYENPHHVVIADAPDPARHPHRACPGGRAATGRPRCR